MSEIADAVRAELESLSQDDLMRELEKIVTRRQKQKERTNSPETIARRRAYYEKAKDTPEWKASRKVAAARRKAKQEKLLELAKETFTPEQLAEIGL